MMPMQAKLHTGLPLSDTAVRRPLDGLAIGLWYNRVANQAAFQEGR
jgi:hypothetical protein